MGVNVVPAINNKCPRTLFKTPKPRTKKPPPEWKLQAAVVSDWHKCQDMGWRFEFAGDMNAGKRNGLRAKLTGLKAGETDLRIYAPGARLGMIELKTARGVLNAAQKERHDALTGLGFKIHVVKAATESEAVTKCRAILKGMVLQ